jgi:hypothetical protein
MDTQYPIARVMAGMDVDFESVNSPSSDADCSKYVVHNSFIAAKLFNHLTEFILQDLLGIHASNGHIDTCRGIFGTLKAYFATVGANSHGALQLHMLLWVKDGPTAAVMERALLSDRFHSKIKAFIDACIQGTISGPGQPFVNSAAEAYRLQTPTDSSTTGSAISSNVPRELSPTAWVDEEGRYGPSCSTLSLLPWNPTLIQAIPVRHTVELLTHGPATIDRTSTIVKYITRTYAPRRIMPGTSLGTLRSVLASRTFKGALVNQALAIELTNEVNKTLSIPVKSKVMYLMGFGDMYLSHVYVDIFWSGIVHELLMEYPELRRPQCVSYFMIMLLR